MANPTQKGLFDGRSMFEAWLGNGAQAWTSGVTPWETLSSTLTLPESLESVLKTINPSSESLLKLTETGWKNLNVLMESWRAGSDTQKPDTLMFPGLDRDALSKWSELYDKEFRKFLHIPQLGLTRFHQEKINHAMDAFVRFQNALAEFLHLLYEPIETSGKDMQKTISELGQNGRLPETAKEYYNIWVKLLEKRYMALFKTDDYLRSLGKTVQAMESYSGAKKDVIDGFLQAFSIPTTKDMDDVYQDLYALKKQVKTLEKTLNAMAAENTGGQA